MITELCLTFLSLQGSAQGHVPAHIRELALKRVTHQIAQSLPEHRVSFDGDACPVAGTYYFDSQNIILAGDNALWRGRLQISLTDLLDGKKIPFATHLQTKATSTTPFPHPERKRKRWLPWLIGGAAAVLVGGAALYYRENQARGKAPPGGTEPPTLPSSEGPAGPKPLSF
jgi:hypothetical protein